MSQQPPPQPVPPHRPQKESANALDAIIPTNPLAAVSCYTGIVSIILCVLGPLLGPIAIVTGYLGLKKWNVAETEYGKTTSTIRAWIGIVTGIIGTVVGLIVIVLIIISAVNQ